MKKIYNSVNIKISLLIIAVAIAAGTLFYTQGLIKRLQEREKEIVQLYAQSLEFIANSETQNSDITFIFQNIIQKIDFPVILTNSEGKVTSEIKGSGYNNIEIDPKLTQQQKIKFLQEKVRELAKIHPPINVKYKDVTLSKIYYGDSDLVQRLRYYPYLQIIFAIFFILIAYTGFNYLKKSEQSNIWVGMSKETAHQLGTPISSLMGWNEILKMNYNNPDKVLDASEEISNDITRLYKIAKRFSKIGSKPELVEDSPYEVIENVINYFQRRLPQLGKNVTINLTGDKNIKARMNAELFEWVIENLIKNSLDAIEHKEGRIDLEIKGNKKFVEIEVKDNGKGIEHKNKKDIFRPGFSTKRRGWGLGLSLSKRIIEDYHNGKIFVKQTIPNEGTTFKILLRAI
ncbi:PAS domain-containing sensor histidine kinase [Melioribacteraceae bacterium 4301-Me]|uniref:sensor histidine kinase n=1 Tax=Pyranulibacter aquaticus TaxID=3163344 RepID=UPI00359A5961